MLNTNNTSLRRRSGAERRPTLGLTLTRFDPHATGMQHSLARSVPRAGQIPIAREFCPQLIDPKWKKQPFELSKFTLRGKDFLRTAPFERKNRGDL